MIYGLKVGMIVGPSWFMSAIAVAKAEKEGYFTRLAPEELGDGWEASSCGETLKMAGAGVVCFLKEEPKIYHDIKITVVGKSFAKGFLVVNTERKKLFDEDEARKGLIASAEKYYDELLVYAAKAEVEVKKRILWDGRSDRELLVAISRLWSLLEAKEAGDYPLCTNVVYKLVEEEIGRRKKSAELQCA